MGTRGQVNDCQSRGAATSQSYVSDISSQLTDSQIGEEIQHRTLSVHKFKRTNSTMEMENAGVIRIIPSTVRALEFLIVHLQIQGAVHLFTSLGFLL